jgi:hypothetical protein
MNEEQTEIARLNRKIDEEKESHFASVFIILWCVFSLIGGSVFGSSNFSAWLGGIAGAVLAYVVAKIAVKR